jgi:hypothetical protein
VDFSDDGDEFLDSLTSGSFLDQLKDLLLLKDHSVMELTMHV